MTGPLLQNNKLKRVLLKYVLHGKLKDSRILSASDLSERSRGRQRCDGYNGGAGLGGSKVESHVVREIKGLESDLQLLVFPDGEISHDGCIDLQE
jgi:hypothetical protein